jgi:hypothetical protein
MGPELRKRELLFHGLGVSAMYLCCIPSSGHILSISLIVSTYQLVGGGPFDLSCHLFAYCTALGQIWMRINREDFLLEVKTRPS